MPQLNRDLLREVFYELIKNDGFKDIDTFMMAGKESFQLVLDICRKTNDIVIFDDKIDAKSLIQTSIFTNQLLFKPISIAFASSLTSLNIGSFSSALIPMLKFIDWELKDIFVSCENLKAIGHACSNIQNVENGVTIKAEFCKADKFFNEMKDYSFRCQNLTIIDADFNEIWQERIKNPHLRTNIRDLTIHGSFYKTLKFQKELKEFAAFLSSTFPNLKNLNINFSCETYSDTWDFKDSSMADVFSRLPHNTKGFICFKYITANEIVFDPAEFSDVQKNDDGEYYKDIPITKTFNFKLASFYNDTISTSKALRILMEELFRDFDEMNRETKELALAIARYDAASQSNNPLTLAEKPKKVKFDKKQFSTKSAQPIFKNLRSYKPIRNRFSR